MHRHIQVCLNNATKIDISRAIDVSIAYLRTRPAIEFFVPMQIGVNAPATGAGIVCVSLVHDHHIGVFVIESLVQQSLAELVVGDDEHHPRHFAADFASRYSDHFLCRELGH
jgi:hypothetical protein